MCYIVSMCEIQAGETPQSGDVLKKESNVFIV